MFIVSHLMQRIRPQYPCSNFLLHFGGNGGSCGGGFFATPISLDDVDE